MHPGMLYWWKYARRHGDYGAWAGCDPAGGYEAWAGRYSTSGHHHDDLSGGAFGVRRPLRFLAFKLDLDERQVSELAKVLAELKTERAQAEVDRRRTVAAFADAVAGDAFDAARAAEGAGLRVKSAESLRDAVVRALEKIHAILDEEQRAKLAYLIRTGVLTI